MLIGGSTGGSGDQPPTSKRTIGGAGGGRRDPEMIPLIEQGVKGAGTGVLVGDRNEGELLAQIDRGKEQN